MKYDENVLAVQNFNVYENYFWKHGFTAISKKGTTLKQFVGYK